MTDQDPKPFSSTPERLDWLPEAEVSLERLRQVLIAAYCTAEPEEPYLYVSDGIDFPLWVVLDADRKLINFFTHVPFANDDAMRQLEATNRLNADLVAVQFNVKEGHLWGSYWLPFNDGLSVLHFVLMLRRVASAFLHGTRHPSALPLFMERAMSSTRH